MLKNGKNKIKKRTGRLTALLPPAFVWGVFWANPWKSEAPHNPGSVLCNARLRRSSLCPCFCKETPVSPAWPSSFPALKRNPLPAPRARGITGLQRRGLATQPSFLQTRAAAPEFCCGLRCTGCLSYFLMPASPRSSL